MVQYFVRLSLPTPPADDDDVDQQRFQWLTAGHFACGRSAGGVAQLGRLTGEANQCNGPGPFGVVLCCVVLRCVPHAAALRISLSFLGIAPVVLALSFIACACTTTKLLSILQMPQVCSFYIIQSQFHCQLSFPLIISHHNPSSPSQ